LVTLASTSTLKCCKTIAIGYFMIFATVHAGTLCVQVSDFPFLGSLGSIFSFIFYWLELFYGKIFSFCAYKLYHLCNYGLFPHSLIAIKLLFPFSSDSVDFAFQQQMLYLASIHCLSIAFGSPCLECIIKNSVWRWPFAR
jgi:hypothetical protein